MFCVYNQSNFFAVERESKFLAHSLRCNNNGIVEVVCSVSCGMSKSLKAVEFELRNRLCFVGHFIGVLQQEVFLITPMSDCLLIP